MEGIMDMNQEERREREKMYTCWLCNFPNIGNAQLRRLSESCGGPEGVYHAGMERWGRILNDKQVEALKRYTEQWPLEAKYLEMREEGIELVTISDQDYPERLKNIPDAPYCLFVRGRLPSGDVPAVAVIGARECSEYGRYVARELGTALGRHGVVVVSGMAKGIDGISQEAALDGGGISLGVLGSGVDICYPARNIELYRRLTEGGAVLSTYPLGTPARPQNFPPRNRIVSGLADAVVVIEARARSGTLITVDMALEQ
ncbi:MAG TPA: DNA-protecting protein DprA, partial [Lachnospiraceae bacterium]|nr:DNA-protecting protein DprA [Lachnospiraceae bacterium]